MSEQEDKMASVIANLVVDRLVLSLQDETIVDKVIDVWGAKLDRTIGRGLRRLGFYILITIIIISTVKLGLFEKFLSFLKP